MSEVYVFDLDGTLCTETKGEYEKAEPYKDRINKVNQIYLQGHKIIIDSARGTLTQIDKSELTKNQLEKWGVKYHILRTGVKFFGHHYIDDKGINDKDFF